MELISPDEFLEWSRRRSIEPDKRYAPPQCLVYVLKARHHRFWEVPERPAAIPYFVSHLLVGLGRWSHCHVWPRGGVWPQAEGTDRPDDRVRDVMLRGVGIPGGFEGAVRYGEDELDRLITVVFAQLLFGWSVPDDLFVIPDHGRQFLQTDHHGVVHVNFAEQAFIELFVKHMADQDYSLPTDLPDATFRRPKWMK